MELARKKRGPVRAQITKTIAEANAELVKDPLDRHELSKKMKKLQRLQNEMVELDEIVKNGMLNGGCTEDEYTQETTAIEEYVDKLEDILLQLEAKIDPIRPASPAHSSYSTASQGQKSYKLPKVELQKFDGTLKSWLGWWAQFRQIHDDEDLPINVKFQYLIQATVPGSEAEAVIKIYPRSDENYPLVIEAFKARFGDKKILRQIYLRELLNLAFKNTSNQKEQMDVRTLHDQLDGHLKSLESLGKVTDPMELIFPLVESSLPQQVLLRWQSSSVKLKEKKADGSPITNLENLMEFLRMEAKNEIERNLAQSTFGKPSQEKGNKKGFNPKALPSSSDVPTIAGLHISTTNKGCLLCEKVNHETKECRKAKQLSLKEKESKIKEKKGCLKCFKIGHFAQSCKTFVECLACHSSRHQTIMCPKINNPTPEETPETINLSVTQGVVLETLVVRVVHGSRKINARVFLDRGATRSFISKSMVSRVGCKPVGTQVFAKILLGDAQVKPKVHNLYQIRVEDLSGQVSRELKLTEQEPFICRLPQIPDGAWIQELKMNKIKLSDFNNCGSTDIDILIGADQMTNILTNKSIELKCGMTATETIFGWVLFGTVTREETIGSIICCHLKDSNLSDFWNLETLGIRDPIEKETDAVQQMEAKKSFIQNLRRTSDGRYSVGLPWISETRAIPTNRNVAEARVINMSKGLVSKGKFNQYNEVLRTWLEEGLIEEVNDNKNEKCHYLPHRPVFKESSLTTPCRPVFDASCKVGRNPSLNECLYTGPNLIELLPTILMRFREKEIGVISDIKKAFMMIGVNQEDRDYLRFFWWENEKMDKLKTFRHCRVLFGVNSSPFLLAATIEHHLNSYFRNDEFKPIAQILLKSLYIDNCVTSVNNYEEYEMFRGKATSMMAEAGMDLRLWEYSGEESTGKTKVLGMIWDKKEDTLTCEIPDKPMKITKRSILSILHQVFDPVGHLSPALLQPKVLLQKTWVQKCDWDDEKLPLDITSDFIKWVEELPILKELKIPRQVCYANEGFAKQLHMFSDASKDGYSAAIFLRSETNEGVNVQLIQAKNRVAPLKKSTINRLELVGCWIGANLTKTVKEALNFHDIPTFYWTDSSTALAWIKRNNSWGTFVGNRVKKIIAVSRADEWRHIPGVHNPADLPSRGCSPKELLQSRWWEGPVWLRAPMEQWPITDPSFNEEDIELEEKKSCKENIHANMDIKLEEPRFSSYTKNVKVYGWVRRYVTNLYSRIKRKDPIQNPYLTVQEIRDAEEDMIKNIQRDTIPQQTDSIWGLKLEEVDGILRVKTQLSHGKDSLNFRKPILLPKAHPLVEQLIINVHRSYGHPGIQFVMGKIREKFWIPQSRKTIRSILRKCVTCRRWDAQRMEVDPATLPEKRITISETFHTTGVDLAGPLILKDKSKVWIVLYTCAVYRCVHLDLVTSLSTEAFLKSLERFINTEGRPNTLFSDNGTNFVGAANLLKMLKWEELTNKFNVKQISWTFNPPTAAWWGGWWERLVRTTKDLLRRTLGPAKLNFDELRTSLTAVSHTINGRPLTTVTEDPNDFLPLTPAMFLKGLPMQGFPESEVISTKDLQSNYKKLGNLKRQFQTRFRNEYLAQLVKHSHSKKIPSSAKVGDVVLVGADNVKRFLWPMGRIIELISGKDGKTRVARVKTKNGILLRPLQRLYPLEVPNPDQLPVPTPEVKMKAIKHKEIQDTSEQEIPEDLQDDGELPILTRSGRKIIKPSRFGQWH